MDECKIYRSHSRYPAVRNGTRRGASHEVHAHVEHRYVARRAGTAARPALPLGVLLSSVGAGMERNALEQGLIDADEIAVGHYLRPGKRLERVMTMNDVGHAVTRGSSMKSEVGFSTQVSQGAIG